MSNSTADLNWLEPEHLYLQRVPDCEVDRPLFQGDVLAGVPLPVLPSSPPAEGKREVEFVNQLVMVVPHPCQCYNGDNPRPRLTVAPITEVADYATFGEERTGAKDKFALPDLPVPAEDGTWAVSSHVADLGRLTTVGKKYLKTTNRVACLSHEGLGLLAKRVLAFQLRFPVALGAAMTYTAGEWAESFLMQAWVRRHRTLKGYSAWMHTPTLIPGVGSGQPVAPYAVRAGALDILLELISGVRLIEPGAGPTSTGTT
ncbi:MAG: hypothetical protein M3524_05335 [Actinomycetota bacterium]|nr:hypothetical protein [Actinomycetota bacterium]